MPDSFWAYCKLLYKIPNDYERTISTNTSFVKALASSSTANTKSSMKIECNYRCGKTILKKFTYNYPSQTGQDAFWQIIIWNCEYTNTTVWRNRMLHKIWFYFIVVTKMQNTAKPVRFLEDSTHHIVPAFPCFRKVFIKYSLIEKYFQQTSHGYLNTESTMRS